ncbi:MULTISPECIES: hypothetical protein [Streptomyces]|uniref:hypothetical protein n=1 Tax=Streptomyces TaxID=1883 RepID=UPI00240D52B6|nr:MULTISPECIES: hypothetical protein [Streptomyces]WFB88501.1 hypothetical protein MMU79_37310 [Streptomyces olivaceus]WGK50943.1 hypothetical protein M6G09_38050 [Streptomyces sp. B146]
MPEHLKVDHNQFAAGEQGLVDLLEGLIGGMREYIEGSSFNPQDPPWGTDVYGKQFEVAYLDTHKKLTEAVLGMEGALANVLEITSASRKNYLTAQEDAVITVGNEGRRS